MMRVFKYQFDLDDEVEVKMPFSAKVLRVAEQHGRPTMWALVDDEHTVHTFRFLIRGTGHPVPYGVGHVGTFFAGAFVWHVFRQEDF